MKNLAVVFSFLVVCCFALVSGLAKASSKGELTEISHEDNGLLQKAFISLHHSVHSGMPDEKFLVYLTEQDSKLLLSKGFTLKPLSKFPSFSIEAKNAASSAQTITDFQCYETLAESQSTLFELSIDYPNLVELITIGLSERKQNAASGHDLEVLKITEDNGIEDKPKLFIHAAMHAREYATAPMVLAFIKHMLEGFETDADINWILRHNEIHVLLFMNPDGREKAEQGLLWRKNTNDAYCQEDSFGIGVDLNRNFTYAWGSTPNGSSSDECSPVFRGPHEASEPETQAVESYMRSIFADRRGPSDTDKAPDDVAGMHLDIHSYGNLVLWPWGHTDIEAPNALELEVLGRKLAFFNDYTPMQSIGLYPTDGTSESISYGELGIAHFTFELGTEFFEDCDYYERYIKQQNIEALKYAARVVAAPYQLPLGPEVSDLKVNGDLDRSVSNNQNVTVTIGGTTEQIKLDEDSNSSVVGFRFSINELPDDESNNTYSVDMLSTENDALGRAWGVFSTQGLSEGRHSLYAQSLNEQGHWGPVYSAFFEVGDNASIGAAPVADFEVDCSGLICLLDASKSVKVDGEIVEYKWLISAGEFEQEGQQTRYVFRNAGEFPVQLFVTDANGNQASYQRLIDVKNDVAADEIEASVSCTELECTFSNDPSLQELVSYTWLINGQEYDNDPTVVHQFAASGTFQWGLVGIDRYGRVLQTTDSIDVIDYATVVFEPEITCTSQNCRFNLADVDTTFTDYGWVINGANYPQTTNVQVQIGNNDLEWSTFATTNANDQVEQSGVISASEVRSGFGADISVNCNKLQCTFVISNLPEQFDSASWTISGNGVASGLTTSTTFSRSGVYTYSAVLHGEPMSFEWSGEVEVDDDSKDSGGAWTMWWFTLGLVLLRRRNKV